MIKPTDREYVANVLIYIVLRAWQVQFNNKKDGTFTGNDVRLMKMLCIHVSEFIATVGSDDD